MHAEDADYRGSWDSFWRDVATTTGEVFWDSDPTEAILRELPLFADRLDAALPLIDLGCGNGTQTAALARRFARVVGVDIAETAVRGARELHPLPNLEFRGFDMLDRDAGAGLHAELGDANVYMRAVLHQLRAADRRPAARTIAELLGARGKAFVVELAPAAEALFAGLARGASGPPPKLARVFQHGIVPASLAAGEVAGLFAELGLVATYTGRSAIVTTQALPSGAAIEVPCDAWLFERA